MTPRSAGSRSTPYFLVFATGAKLLEKTRMQREGYPEDAERTSMFVPLPPRKQPVS